MFARPKSGSRQPWTWRASCLLLFSHCLSCSVMFSVCCDGVLWLGDMRGQRTKQSDYVPLAPSFMDETVHLQWCDFHRLFWAGLVRAPTAEDLGWLPYWKACGGDQVSPFMGEISFSPLTWLPQTLLGRVDPSTGHLLVLGGSSIEKHVAGISSVFQFLFLKNHIGILIGIYLNLYNG